MFDVLTRLIRSLCVGNLGSSSCSAAISTRLKMSLDTGEASAMTNMSEDGANWRLILLSAGVGAIVMGLSYLYLQRTRKNFKRCHSHKDRTKNIKCNLQRLLQACEDTKIDIKEQLSSIKDDIDDQVDGVISVIKNSLLSKEMQEAVETIEYVLEKLKQYDMEAKQYEGFMFLLIALLKKAQIHEEKKQRSGESEIRMTDEKLGLVKKYGHVAVRMYPLSWVSNRDTLAQQLGVSADNIIQQHFSDDDDLGHCPKYLLYTDHSNIVLAIRGTFSLKDAVLDAVAEEEEFLDGMAHKGILSGSRIILSQVVESIKSHLSQHPDHGLVVTGHSLGAGTAELITLELLTSGLLPPDTRVHCIALAPPPVFRSDHSLPHHISSAVDIFINNSDCVPRLSLASLARLLSSIRAVDEWSRDYSISDQVRILLDNTNTSDEDLEKINRAVARVKQTTFPDLDHPGTVYHLQNGVNNTDDDGNLIYLSKSKIFTHSILLLDNMILDHLHTSYEHVLKFL